MINDSYDKDDLNSKIEYKYLVSGDSISKGVIYDEEKSKYTVLENNYVAILQSKLKGMVSNTSRFGNTLLKGIGKLKSDAIKDNPDFVLIEYGGNDCDFNWGEISVNPEAEHFPKTDYNVFEKLLKESIEFLKGNGITPVLLTLPPLNPDRYFKWVSRNNTTAETNILKWLGSITKIYWWQERYNSTIMRVSEETLTKLIDIRGAFLRYPDFSKLLCLDGIHPNKEGHIVIAEKILDFIKSGYDYLLLDNIQLI